METIENSQAISVSQTVRVVSYQMAWNEKFANFGRHLGFSKMEEKGSSDTSFSGIFPCRIQWWNLEGNIFNHFRDIEEFWVKMAEKPNFKGP